MSGGDIIAALDALADLLADRVVARLAAKTVTSHYDAKHLPPGASSWRACLEAGRRGELEVTRIGRRSVVAADAWTKYLEAKRARPTKPSPAGARTSAVERLERLGCVVPIAAGGRR